MPTFFTKEKQQIKGPFTIQQISKMNLRRSMLFSVDEKYLWHRMSYYPEIEEVYKSQRKKRVLKFLPWLLSIFVFLTFVFVFLLWRKKEAPVPISPKKEEKITQIQKDEPIVIRSKHKVSKQKREKRVRSSLQLLSKTSVTSLPSMYNGSIQVSGNENRKKYVRNHLPEFVKTDCSSFVYGDNAGVQDVYAVVENTSEYVLGELTIRADYLNQNKTLIYSEFIVFENVTPFREIRKKASSKNNCSSVLFLIVNIKSKALALYFTPERAATSSSDPFYYIP